MLDFGTIPPEITSALIYAGSGSASLQAAASAWNGLAAELNSAATGYNTVITQLVSDEWMGPASTSMADAAAPYVAWMNATAAQAEQAAGSARAAAAAYEQALASAVPPQLVAANRAETAAAVQANVFGQYTPLIAQLEAQYGEMWAQDAATMYSYAGQSAAATRMTPFAAPAQTTNPAGQATQAAAVNQAAGNAAGSSAQSTLSQLMSSLNGLLGGLASPADATDPWAQFLAFLGVGALDSSGNWLSYPSTSLIGSLLTGLGGSSTLNPAWAVGLFRNFAGPIYNIEGLPYFSIGMANTLLALQKGLAPAAAAASGAGAGAAAAGGAAAGAAAGAGAGLGGLGGLGGGVSAGLGGAGAVGKLAVPPSWIGGAPLAAPHAPLAISSVSAAPESAGAGNLLGGMPLAGAGMGGIGGSGPRYGFKPTVMARPPFAG
jgi:PPE-repeat protein